MGQGSDPGVPEVGTPGSAPLSQGKDIMKQFKNLVRPYLIWSFILIVVPLLLIVLYSVTTGGNSLVNIQFTGENFKKIFEPVYMNVFIRSFKLGAITTIISLIIGYMLAYVV